MEFSSAFTEVPSLHNGRLLVTLVHILNKLRVYLLYVFFPWRQRLNPKVKSLWIGSYLFEFILAEKGLADMFSSIGRLTDGIGMFEIPLSYNLRFNSFFLALSGTKLLRSIYGQN